MACPVLWLGSSTRADSEVEATRCAEDVGLLLGEKCVDD
jgi:hypothetical protein